MPNESELSLLTGMPVETIDDVRNATSALLEAGVKNVIVTLGSRGVLWMAEGIDELVSAHTVQARDTTGAGDAFIGCFSHYLVKTGNVLESLRKANRYAADSVTKLGTQTSYATAEELAQLSYS
ncbi:PfkB family carbohydrate kinase [Arcanobacterium pinnipediorum]|uniref:PfkB family carbohydrate kinase n=1 Tax=Arcanobacterium pinnipediorum TaxID=1503041 RepID=A0ABY5AH42_9ACTO|nr:PfkB family carbohydrate kinase [Arcanobacterium pinnipediorum]USR79326.1 PfkB family carbohydrate kinase [Arcanobacterium pinnipediorum]